MNILLVDDDQSILKTLNNKIEQHGFQCTSYNNATDALKFFKENNIDIVITDIKMPDMNGVEFISKLYNYNHKIKIIIITGLIDFELIGDYIKQNIIASFEKPFRSSNLIQKIKNETHNI